ncbi:MAG: hypothetical protein HZB39_19855 [Planctomycetes bacterium]|nr:hypothetical protein [Planctomycetota bacterium]
MNHGFRVRSAPLAPTCVLLLAAAIDLPAQQLVLPAGYDAREGEYRNSHPAADPVAGADEVAWRRDGSALAVATLTRNQLTPPVTVFARRNVACADPTAAPA